MVLGSYWDAATKEDPEHVFVGSRAAVVVADVSGGDVVDHSAVHVSCFLAAVVVDALSSVAAALYAHISVAGPAAVERGDAGANIGCCGVVAFAGTAERLETDGGWCAVAAAGVDTAAAAEGNWETAAAAG